MSKNLYTLPQRWEWKKLENVAILNMGQSPDSSTYNSDGNGLPFFQGKKDFGKMYPVATQYCSSPVKIALENDILMSVRAPVGPTNIANMKCCIGRGLAGIRAKQEIETLFLYYFFKYFEEEISNKGKGSTFSAITKVELATLDIPLPPLEEQGRIVGVLDGLFGKIDKSIALLDESIASASSLMPSALNEVFEELGIKHEMVAVKQVIMNIQTGTTPSKQIEKYYKVPLEIEWFSPSDFKEEKILHNSKNKLNKIALEERKVKLYDENSLLLVAIGATVGKIGVIREKATSNQQITALKFDNSVNVDFAYYWFRHIKEFIIGQASTATLPIINQNGIKELPFIKVPLDIQTQTVAYLDALHVKADALKKAQEKKKEALLALKASLLESAFKGAL